MLPYQAVAMDYGGYQRQGPATGGHMGMGLGMGVGAPPFTHSWLVPPQDLCGVPYGKQMPNQHPHMQPQQIEPGHVFHSFIQLYFFPHTFALKEEPTWCRIMCDS